LGPREGRTNPFFLLHGPSSLGNWKGILEEEEGHVHSFHDNGEEKRRFGDGLNFMVLVMVKVHIMAAVY
jgi:hypothetical protein